MTQKAVRQPTQEERKQLIDFLIGGRPSDADEAEVRQYMEEVVAGAYIAVFDSYVTNSVGYAGKVMIVVYDSSPKDTETYTWGKAGYLQEEVTVPKY